MFMNTARLFGFGPYAIVSAVVFEGFHDKRTFPPFG